MGAENPRIFHTRSDRKMLLNAKLKAVVAYFPLGDSARRDADKNKPNTVKQVLQGDWRTYPSTDSNITVIAGRGNVGIEQPDLPHPIDNTVFGGFIMIQATKGSEGISYSGKVVDPRDRDLVHTISEETAQQIFTRLHPVIEERNALNTKTKFSPGSPKRDLFRRK